MTIDTLTISRDAHREGRKLCLQNDVLVWTEKELPEQDDGLGENPDGMSARRRRESGLVVWSSGNFRFFVGGGKKGAAKVCLPACEGRKNRAWVRGLHTDK